MKMFKTIMLLIFAIFSMNKCNELYEKINPDNEIVKIDINDTKFDIPLRYFYVDTIEKRGNWRKPPKERKKIGAVKVSVLLPTYEPYSENKDSSWRVLGFGDIIHITIAKNEDTDWHSNLNNKYLKDGLGNYYKREGNHHELIKFTNGSLTSKFIPENTNANLNISCSKDEVKTKNYSPGCIVESKYSNKIKLTYTYSRNHLHKWKQIDENIKIMLDGFETQESKTSK